MKNKSILERRDNVLTLVAYASLKHNGESTDIDNIAAEKFRLDRIISNEFVKSKNDKEYNQFCIDFLKENADDIVYTDKFVFDIEYPDEPYELNVDVMIDKLHRKNTCLSSSYSF